MQSSKHTRILAIDPGFERMGVAVLARTADKPQVMYSSCIKTSARDEFAARLCAIGEKLESIVKKYAPETLAIEKLFFSTNQKTALRVAEARGVAVYVAARHRLSLREYAPVEIKTAVANYGHATKNQVTTMVPQLVDFKATKKITRGKKVSDDEFDAIAVGITHFACSRYF